MKKKIGKTGDCEDNVDEYTSSLNLKNKQKNFPFGKNFICKYISVISVKYTYNILPIARTRMW